MDQLQTPSVESRDNENNSARRSVLFGVIGIVLMACIVASIYIGLSVPFLVLITGPAVTLPLAFIATVISVIGIVLSVRALRSTIPSKTVAWVGAGINSLIAVTSAGILLIIFSLVGPTAGLNLLPSPETYFSMTASPSGSMIAAAHGDKIELLDAQNGTWIKTLKGHKQDVDSLVFSADGRLLASSSFLDHNVKLWDMSSYKEIKSFNQPGDWPQGLFFSADGKALTILWRELGAVVMDTSTYATVNSYSFGEELLPRNGYEIFYPGDHLGMIDSQYTQLRVWGTDDFISAPGSAPLMTIPMGQGLVHDYRLSRDGSLLSLPSQILGEKFDSELQIWDVRTPKMLESIRFKAPPDPQGLYFVNAEFSPDNKSLAYIDQDHRIVFIDIATLRSTPLLASDPQFSLAPSTFNFSADGKNLLVTDGNSVQMWNAASGALIWKYP